MMLIPTNDAARVGKCCRSGYITVRISVLLRSKLAPTNTQAVAHKPKVTTRGVRAVRRKSERGSATAARTSAVRTIMPSITRLMVPVKMLAAAPTHKATTRMNSDSHRGMPVFASLFFRRVERGVTPGNCTRWNLKKPYAPGIYSQVGRLTRELVILTINGYLVRGCCRGLPRPRRTRLSASRCFSKNRSITASSSKGCGEVVVRKGISEAFFSPARRSARSCR